MRERSRRRGFTLMELLVVMSILALLVALVVRNYDAGIDRANEAVLRHNLATMRDAIDRFHADKRRYPRGLEELVEARYLKQIPLDPVTRTTSTWVLAPPRDGTLDGVADVKSGAVGNADDGTPFSSL